MVQSTFEESPPCTNHTSKGNARTKVSKIKRDLFAWLILFQPELNQVEEVITQIDLGSNLFQIRGDDGDPSMPLNLEHQISKGNLILLAKG